MNLENLAMIETGTAALPLCLAAQATPPPENDLAALVEAVMASVAPGPRPSYQIVNQDALQLLCRAAGVRWRAHWAVPVPSA